MSAFNQIASKLSVSSLVFAVTCILSYASAIKLAKSVTQVDIVLQSMNLTLFYTALCTALIFFIWATATKKPMYPHCVMCLTACCVSAACLYAHFLTFQAPSATFVHYHCVTEITFLFTKCIMGVVAAVQASDKATAFDTAKPSKEPEQSTPKCVKLDIIVL